MGLRTVMKDAPTHRQTLKSREAPDGTKRYGFWSPELKGERKTFGKFALLIFSLITVFMFLFLSIYFGSYYRQIHRSPHLSIEIIDLDSLASPFGQVAHPAILGPAVQAQVQSQKAGELPTLGYYLADSATLQNFRLETGGQGVDAFEYGMRKVDNQDVWGVMIVNANATSGVWAAITSGAQWTPGGAITFIVSEARNFYAAEQYILRLGNEFITQATSSASTELASQVLALGNASAVLQAIEPSSLIGAFGVSQYTLQPFDQLAGIAATTVGAIYLIIFTFLITLLWNNMGLPIIQSKLSLGSEVLVKILVPWLGYFWISLHFSLVSVAFLVDFTRKYGRVGFFIYWMANWVTMSGLGFVMESMFLWLGPFFPFFLLFWVIINVSVAFLDLALMDNFYMYAYALPVWNLVDASKSIIFATKNHLGQNFGVNLSWMICWMLILAVTVIFQRRKTEREGMKQKWEEMKEKEKEKETGNGGSREDSR